MATITVNYTANYLGDHRICYRRTGTVDYCCLTDTVTAVGPQTFVIDFATPADYCSGDPEEVTPPVETDCGPYDYEGYIQPICETIDSINGRSPFIASFTLTPTCLAYVITCNSAGVGSIVVDDIGAGYAAIPTVTFTGGGGGAGATASAVMQTYSAGITLGSNAGTDYVVGEQVYISGGTGTAIQLSVLTIGGAGEILTFLLVGIGAYTVLPGTNDVASTSSLIGVNANFDILYSVGSITVSVAGDDYTSAPTVVIENISPGPAAATAYLLPCADFTAPSCGTDATVGISVGQNVVFCDTTGLPVLADDGYSVAADPDVYCCSCSQIAVAAFGKAEVIPYIYYTDADTHDVVYLDNGGLGYACTTPATTILLGPLGDQANARAVDNSWGAAPGYYNNLSLVIITPCP